MCAILKLDNLWRESPILISLYVDSKGTFPESSYMQVVGTSITQVYG